MSETLTSGGAALRDAFMNWQCLIRQHAMRNDGGRPSEGMQPALTRADGTEAGRVTVIIVEGAPAETTAQLRHTVRRTQDPAERRNKGLAFLSSSYYQKSKSFEPRLFALFGPGSPLAAGLADDGRCVLSFRQFSQSWRLPAAVTALDDDDPFAQALFWMSAIFNPALPPGTVKLAFAPVWDEATAFPPVGG